MNADELQATTKEFALYVINLVSALPKTVAGRTIPNQIVRSGISVAANYRSPCRARSCSKFIAKIGIALEETDETLLSLKLIFVTNLLPAARVDPFLEGADELNCDYSRYSQICRLRGQNRRSEIYDLKCT
jgi:four helix bundle protein